MTGGIVFNEESPPRLMALPVHAVHLSVNASGLADVERVATALEWLLGIDDCVQAERTPSFHGSPMFLLTASAASKGKARKVVPDSAPPPSTLWPPPSKIHPRTELTATTTSTCG